MLPEEHCFFCLDPLCQAPVSNLIWPLCFGNSTSGSKITSSSLISLLANRNFELPSCVCWCFQLKNIVTKQHLLLRFNKVKMPVGSGHECVQLINGVKETQANMSRVPLKQKPTECCVQIQWFQQESSVKCPVFTCQLFLWTWLLSCPSHTHSTQQVHIQTFVYSASIRWISCAFLSRLYFILIMLLHTPQEFILHVGREIFRFLRHALQWTWASPESFPHWERPLSPGVLWVRHRIQCTNYVHVLTVVTTCLIAMTLWPVALPISSQMLLRVIYSCFGAFSNF